MSERPRRNLARERAEHALARQPAGAGLLALARAVETALGCVPPESWPALAARAGCDEREVARLLERTSELPARPSARHRVTICTGRTCSRRGGAGLLRAARRALGTRVFAASADGAVYLEPFSCFGQCAMAPNIWIDGSVRGAMSEPRLLLLLDMLRRRAAAGEGGMR